MEVLGITFGGVLIVLFAVIAAIVSVYNKFVTLKNLVEKGWSDLETALQRRYDLIGNLVETVKGYAQHEKETLTEVIEARSKATEINIDAGNITADQMAQFSQVEAGLSGALGKLFALAEQYPDLKANTNFLDFQKELAVTEDQIKSHREFFNYKVTDYNTLRELFPSNIIAKIFNFTKRDLFEVSDEDAMNAPKVNFRDSEKEDVSFKGE